MGRFAVPIYKWDENGKLVSVYQTTAKAIIMNGLCVPDLEWSITHGTMARGHYYTKTPTMPVLTGQKNPKNTRRLMNEMKAPKNETPWCGEDGYFNIDGWAKVMRIEANSDDKRSIVIEVERQLPKKYQGRRA